MSASTGRGSSIIAELEGPERRTSTAYLQARHLRAGMLTREQCLNIYYLLAGVIRGGVPGDVVEMGCHEGGGSLLLQKILSSFGSTARMHVYDSFHGLPENEEADRMSDGQFYFPKAASLATTREKLEANFRHAKIPLPQIHEGWFSQTLPADLPARIAFAHIDADLYRPTLECLTAIYPRLSPRAVVVIDDYCDVALFPERNIFPGVSRACEEFLAGKPEQIETLHGGLECHACFTRAGTGLT